eukprot:9471280-Pyramimonas_sp.AAC.1
MLVRGAEGVTVRGWVTVGQYAEARAALTGLCEIGATRDGTDLFGPLWQRAMALLVALYVREEVSALGPLDQQLGCTIEGLPEGDDAAQVSTLPGLVY